MPAEESHSMILRQGHTLIFRNTQRRACLQIVGREREVARDKGAVTSRRETANEGNRSKSGKPQEVTLPENLLPLFGSHVARINGGHGLNLGLKEGNGQERSVSLISDSDLIMSRCQSDKNRDAFSLMK